MQREINPVIQISGQRCAAASIRVPIHRYITNSYNLGSANTKDFSSFDMGAAGCQDGSRILDFKVVNRTGRRIAVSIPVDSGLCYFGPNGTPSAVTKERWAPLAKFPSIFVNVPDVVANTIDTNSTTTKLFTVSGTPGATADLITVTLHYVEYV